MLGSLSVWSLFGGNRTGDRMVACVTGGRLRRNLASLKRPDVCLGLQGTRLCSRRRLRFRLRMEDAGNARVVAEERLGNRWLYHIRGLRVLLAAVFFPLKC